MLFNFELKPALECAGLESEETRERYVCWFYLTDSEYFIDLGEVSLFQHSPQWIEKYKEKWPLGIEFVDYQYSRQLEDIFDILPTISCPIPSTLYALVDTSEKRDLLNDKIVNIWQDEGSNDISQDEVYNKYCNTASNFIYYGSLDSSHLRFRTECQFFNVDGMVIIQYNFIDEDEDGCPVWSAGKGIYTLTYNKFVYEIEDLLSRFFSAMDKQIESATQVLSEKPLKKSRLISEHAQRKDYFYGILNSIKNRTYEEHIDWQKLKEDLDYFLNSERKVDKTPCADAK